MNASLIIKKIFRPIYYLFKHGKIVTVKGYPHLSKSKWLINKNYGRAYFKGTYEPEICKYLLSTLDVNSIFIDIGSHAGYLSLFSSILTPNGAVYSFEPELNNFKFISKIKALNNIPNWIIYNKAVGFEKSIMHFETGKTSSTGKINESGELSVEVTSIDIEFISIKKIDLIKIDVEGFGGRVVEGAINSIKKHKPKLMIEIHEGSDELEIVLHYLGSFYEFKDLESGIKIIDVKQKPHFIIGEPII